MITILPLPPPYRIADFIRSARRSGNEVSGNDRSYDKLPTISESRSRTRAYTADWLIGNTTLLLSVK